MYSASKSLSPDSPEANRNADGKENGDSESSNRSSLSDSCFLIAPSKRGATHAASTPIATTTFPFHIPDLCYFDHVLSARSTWPSRDGLPLSLPQALAHVAAFARLILGTEHVSCTLLRYRLLRQPQRFLGLLHPHLECQSPASASASSSSSSCLLRASSGQLSFIAGRVTGRAGKCVESLPSRHLCHT